MPFSQGEHRLFVAGQAGQLETWVSIVDNAKSVAICCHPHSQHGGSMNNKVVHTLHKAFLETHNHTIRFNFRSVGKSEGIFGHGIGETHDLKSIINWAHQNWPNLEIVLSGFSFGAYVSLRLAEQWPLKALISIAPPVERFHFDEIKLPDFPWLVIQPMEDEVINAQGVVDWYQKYSPAHSKLIKFPQSGHFFHGKLIELKQTIKNGLVALGV